MKYRHFLRPFLFAAVILFSISGLLISSAQLNTPVSPSVTSLPSVFDVRGPDGVPRGLGLQTRTPEQVAALTALQQQVGGSLSVQYNGLTATPRHMFSHGRYMSVPSSAPPETIAREFIARWRDIFRFSDADLANLRLKSRATVPDMGVTILLFEQTVSGLPVYKGEVLVNVNRAGQVISVGGESFPVMSIINAAPITPEQSLSDAYTISEEIAITRAAAELGVPAFSPQRLGTQKVPRTFGSAPRAYTDASEFNRGVFTDDIVVTKIIFPLGAQGRLAYKFTLTTPQYYGIMWENIVDGQTGTILRRGSLTSFQSGGGTGGGRRGTFRPDMQDLVEAQNQAGTAQGKVTDTMPTALSGALGFGRSTAPGVPPDYQNPENFTPTATATAGRGFKFSQVNARNESPLIYNTGFGQVLRGFPDALNPSPWSPFGWFYLPTDTGGAEITVANGQRATTRDHGYTMHAGAQTRNAVNPANSPTGNGDQPFSADITLLSGGSVSLPDGRSLSSVFQSRYTEGNNVVVADDHANDNEGTHGIKGYAADRKYTASYFDYLMSYEYGGQNAATGVFPATTHPDVFPATATLFYYNNLIHDYLYSIGFTEALWNFQQDNFGRGGEGGDGVSAQVHDGSGTNNANFGTPADGGSPRMQMYLWTEDAARRSDGDFDFDVVQHEYYHGVSNRSAAKGDTGCLGLGIVVQFPSEAGGQGEGWGDYQAESLTDDDVTGEFVLGEFDRGIRALPMNNFRWSYAAINRRAFNRRDQQTPDPNTSAPSTNPTNYPVFQVHWVGTIFAAMLWDMRELLIMKQKVNSSFPGVFFDGTRRLGSGATFYIGENLVQSVDSNHPINYRESFGTHAVVNNANNLPTVVPNVKAADIVRPGMVASEIESLGHRQGPLATAVGRGARLADTLVLRGLQLSPCNPSIVDTRDSILLADRELTGGENRAVIWRAFASHGVGVGASSTAGTGSDQGAPPAGSAGTTTAPVVVEDFNVPQGVTACEQNGPLPAPAFALSNTTNNTVTITITQAGAAKYLISRSDDADGPFINIGETTGTTFNDNNGGVGLALNEDYFYQVRAARDAEANCVGTANTQSITVTIGVVIQPAPIFAGVDRVDDLRDGDRLIISWKPANSVNPNAQIVYDVYRVDTVTQSDGTQRASFTPSPANRIATGVTGASLSDTGLELGNVYYYIVQARDTNANKIDTNDTGNTITKFNAPTTNAVTGNPPFALETFESNSANSRFTPALNEVGGDPNQSLAAFQRVTGETFGGLPTVAKMYAPEFSPGHEETGCNPNPGGTACGGQADYAAVIGPFDNLTPTSIMEFDHSFNQEEFFDGGVVEISVGDPSFAGATPFPNNATVFDAGNFIIESAYKSPLDGVLEEPVKLSILQGRLAYSGVQSRQHVRISLNDFAPGRTYNPNSLPVYIRFRNTSDAASANGVDAGWFIDNLVINNLVKVALSCIEDNDRSIAYANGWHTVNSANASSGHFRFTAGNDSQHGVTLTFNVPPGTTGKITYYYGKSTKGGTADIYLNSVFRGTINYKGNVGNLKNPEFADYKVEYGPLPAGTYNLEIRMPRGGVYVDKFCLEDSGPTGSPATGPGPTTSQNGSVSGGQESQQTLTLPAGTEAIAVVAEVNPALPVQLVLISPSGAVTTANVNSSGIATINTNAQPGVYTLKVVNVSLGPVEVWTATTPYLRR